MNEKPCPMILVAKHGCRINGTIIARAPCTQFQDNVGSMLTESAMLTQQQISNHNKYKKKKCHSSSNVLVAWLDHRQFFVEKKRVVVLRVDIFRAGYLFWGPHGTAVRELHIPTLDAGRGLLYRSQKFQPDTLPEGPG